jgi:hypothetical protein
MVASVTGHNGRNVGTQCSGSVTFWYGCGCGLGLATESRSEKNPRNRLGMSSVIPRKKVLIPGHSEVYGRVNSEARNERKFCIEIFILQPLFQSSQHL